MKSNCCHADIQAETADEGTSCYVCQKCLKACDPWIESYNKSLRKVTEKKCVEKPKEDWETVFGEMCSKNPSAGSGGWYVAPSTVRAFIIGLLESKLHQRDKEIVALLEGMKVIIPQNTEYKSHAADGYNQAIFDAVKKVQGV